MGDMWHALVPGFCHNCDRRSFVGFVFPLPPLAIPFQCGERGKQEALLHEVPYLPCGTVFKKMMSRELWLDLAESRTTSWLSPAQSQSFPVSWLLCWDQEGRLFFYSFYTEMSACVRWALLKKWRLYRAPLLRCVPELKAAVLHWIHGERGVGSHAAHGQKRSESKRKPDEVHRKYSLLSCERYLIVDFAYESMYISLFVFSWKYIGICVRVCFSTSSIFF